MAGERVSESKTVELPEMEVVPPRENLDFGEALAWMRKGKWVERSTSGTPKFRIQNNEFQVKHKGIRKWIREPAILGCEVSATDWRVCNEAL